MQTLTPGRWRGLKTTANDRSIFTILAFDQRGSYRKMLPKEATYEQAVTVKREVVAALSVHASAVLLDSYYGLESALQMSRNSGLLMALEESGYTGDSTYRGIEFNADWTVSKIKQMGASAVKLLAYYHPDSGALAEEIEGVIRDVVQQAHQHDLPVFLEPVSYSIDAAVAKDSAVFAETRPRVVRETARRLSKLGADVMKMEFPVDAAFNTDLNTWQTSCEAISEVCDAPWVLLSAGVDFETFEKQTQVACKAGASGWLAGRAIWKECVPLSADERQKFLATTGADRIRRLVDVANAHARAWTDFYTPIPVSDDWYKAYSV